MRHIYVLKPKKWCFSGNLTPQASFFGYVVNGDKNEFVIGNLSGDLAIFKGKCQDGYPSYVCRGLGTITCIAIGDVRNHGKNSVVVINAEGHAHIFDIPVKAKHAEQVSVDDYLRGGRRSSDTASVVAFKRMMSNSSYYTTNSGNDHQTKSVPSIYDLEKPNLTLKVPVNVNKILIADIGNNDNKNELVLARTDRILHVFRLVSSAESHLDTKKAPTLNNLMSPSSSSILDTSRKYSLLEVNMWVFDGQISSLCTTSHPERPNESILLVAQPGNTFTIIDKHGKRYNRDFTPQYEQPQQKEKQKEEADLIKDDTCVMTDEAGNTFSRTNYIVRNWPTADNTMPNNQLDGKGHESSTVATEIVVGKRHLSENSYSTNEIGILSMDGKFSIYDLKNKTLSHRDLFVTHKLFSLATLDITKSPARSNIDHVQQNDATKSGIHTTSSNTSQLRHSSGVEEQSEEDSEDVEEDDEDDEDDEDYEDEDSEDKDYHNDSDYESWDEASESEEVPGCDLFVACAWNGVTYLIEWSRRIEDSKIKYQLVKFAFEGRVCAFTAGLYAVDNSGENIPCLFYVDFEDQIYVYYDVRISPGPVNGFIDAIDDDVEEAIDRIIGIEGAIESLIQSEQQQPHQQKQKKSGENEEEEDMIDLGDGWRGVTNEEECSFIKQEDSDPLNLADFIHECLYEFDSMKDKLEKEVLSFEQNTLSNRLPPAADIRRLSDLNISIEPTLDNEVVSDAASILEEEKEENRKYLYSVTRSEDSSEEYDNDIHIASWIEGSLIASSIFKQDDMTSSSSEDDDYS
ncbi:hypothetical protein G6F42_000205 [Rhizopus arrhizus]|nr:hypothetical protein G6F42_000205 [Rhizopus arrhizus]